MGKELNDRIDNRARQIMISSAKLHNQIDPLLKMCGPILMNFCQKRMPMIKLQTAICATYYSINSVKVSFKKTVESQSIRKKILMKMFDKEVQNLICKPVNKRSENYEQHQKVLESTESTYFSTAKEAVIEKYLTFCKNYYIDEMMQWRIKYLALRLTSSEKTWHKLRMNSKRFEERSIESLQECNIDNPDLEPFG